MGIVVEGGVRECGAAASAADRQAWNESRIPMFSTVP